MQLAQDSAQRPAAVNRGHPALSTTSATPAGGARTLHLGERNFFETRVIEHQTGGALNWD